MCAGVRAARGVDHVVLACELTQRAFELCLHRAAVSLLLPAGKVTAVVLEHDFDIHFLTGAHPLPSPLPLGGRGNTSQSTNSMITIGAESPFRGPLWMIRV
jgi:hypothetical protein